MNYPRAAVQLTVLTIVALLVGLSSACTSDGSSDVKPTRSGPINPRTTVLVTIAGNRCSPSSAAQVALQPSAVVVDPMGGFFVAVTDAVHGFVCHVSAGGVVKVAVGAGGAGYQGDGQQALDAELYEPSALAIDRDGGLLICDRRNGRIRRVDQRTGLITTIAGTGTLSFNGDGMAATATDLFLPSGISIAPDGALVIADSKSHRVRRVESDGTVSTIVGTGQAGSSGDGGPAIRASIDLPIGVTFDSGGNLFITDAGAQKLRRVSASDGTISTFGDAGWSNPSALTVDRDGAIVVADAGYERITRIDPVTGAAATVAGNGLEGFAGDGGPAVDASLSYPIGVAALPDGSLLIADAGNHRVRRVGFDGAISTVAGNGFTSLAGDGGPARDAELAQPTAVVAAPGGVLYVADTQNSVIRRIAPDQTITTVAGNGIAGYGGDGGPGTAAKLWFPTALAVGPTGALFIADSWNFRVRCLDPDGIMRTVAGTGAQGFDGDGGPATAAVLNSPAGLAIDNTGNLYIADTENHRIRVVDPSGTITTIAGTGAPGAAGDGGPAVEAQLQRPNALALDGAGNLFVADAENHRVRVVDLSRGTLATVVGTGDRFFAKDGTPAHSTALNGPSGLAFDLAGALYFSEAGNCIVRRIEHPLSPDAVVVTVAGLTPAGSTRPNCGWGGEGILPLGAQLHEPRGLAIGEDGTIYVADSLNSRVRAFVRR